MKFFAILLCICFLGLSYPPIAESDCGATTEQEISNTEDQHHHEQEEDDCATSCLNYCCSHSIILQKSTYSIVLNSIKEDIKLPPYYKFYCKEPSFSIWQPPKTA